MIIISDYIDLLKRNQIWLSDQYLHTDDIISGVPVTDSRLIKAGDVFICIRGLRTDGHKFIVTARDKGAVLIIQTDEYSDTYPAIRVSDSRKAAALLARLYYDDPTSKFNLIGITGTNGKTTTSLLIRQALTNLGYKSGWIGTLGYAIDSEIMETQNTTPDIIELNGIFAQMVSAGCEYVVMEVSSHALALDRVYGLNYKIALFSNLSQEHLDFHKDMESYFESKALLFKYLMETGGTAIVNIDDEYGRRLSNTMQERNYNKVITVSEHSGSVTIIPGNCDVKGCSFGIRETGREPFEVKTSLIGHFNILNATMALTAMRALFPHLPDAEMQSIARKFEPVQGRIEQVNNAAGIGVYVDYAHTPDALKNVLDSISALPHQRIITVFGAGGDRDKGKRPEMLNQALAQSDAVIITDDNPRYEDPDQIIRDIVGNADLMKPWWIIRDRKLAIHSALHLATKGDIVIIAGKGHETYQEIKGVRSHFSDTIVAGEYFNEMPAIGDGELVLPIDQILVELLLHSRFSAMSHINSAFRHISTDSRTIKSQSLYFAIQGESFDGADYLDKVLGDETNAAVIQKPGLTIPNSVYYEDTRIALGKLAAKYLRMFAPLRLAITGSTGKTSTKEYLANIFSINSKVLKTMANENNIIGLSKTIFRIRPDDNVAVFELGTNHFGEIKALAEICHPDIALINNIGPSHLEFFGDENGVYREKAELFRRELRMRIYPGDDPRFEEFKMTGKGVGYSENCDYRISDIKPNSLGIEFKLNGQVWQLSQPAPFMVINAAFAIAAATEAGLGADEIQAGLDLELKLPMRLETERIGTKIVIADCYNANPVSMQAAIEYWRSMNPEKPHVAILGDMLELGEKSTALHTDIQIVLNRSGYDSLLTIGHLAVMYGASSGDVLRAGKGRHVHYETVEDCLRSDCLSSIPENSVVLIKASHGMHLEKLLEALKNG